MAGGDRGGSGRGAGKGAGRGDVRGNVSFTAKKLISMVASLIKNNLMEQGKKEEDEKDSLKEVVSILAGMSALNKSNANDGGKSVNTNEIDYSMAASMKINKIIRKHKS